jgi:hypothetical protein
MNKATDLIFNAIKDKSGFNFDRNGSVVVFKKGFMVGGYHKCLKYITSDQDKLKQGIKEMLGILETNFNNDYVLGWWESNGCIYLDISKNLKDLYESLKVAFNQNQRAIYDIKNDKEILLKNNLTKK